MKCQWEKRLVQRAVKHDLLNLEQFGSVPHHHTSIEPNMFTQLTNNTCRTTKINIARATWQRRIGMFWQDYSATGSTARRSTRRSNESNRIHAETLQNMDYSIRTQFRVPENTYSGTPQQPLFGTGQDSGASPAAWLSIGALLITQWTDS